MNDKHRRANERGQRVRVYMAANEADFLTGSKGFVLASSLEGLLAEVAALDVVRSAGARKRKQGTEGREEMRTALRRMLKTTYDTAKAIALDHPEIKGLFKPPYRGNNDQTLIAEARSAAAAAAPFAAFFTESGLPPAFFDDMRSKADGLEIAASLQPEGADEGVRANAALEDAFRRMGELIDRLDPIVRNKYRDDPAKLAAWESARRVESAPRRKSADDDDPPTPPPADS
jgi:hypothetical protein